MKLEICCGIFGWIFQIATWILLILSIIYKFGYIVVFLSITYFFYIIIELVSPTSAYLYNKISSGEIYQKMDRLFNTRPKIEFICEDANHSYSLLSKKLFQYLFSKDISSPFVLNLQNINLIKKNYIKLRLDEEIIFADSETAHEYEIKKSAFIRMVKRQYQDSNYRIVERKHIPGLINYNLISIKNKEPAGIAFYIFIIFIFLSFGELYKIYLNPFCSYQLFIIKKIVTTHH